MTTLRGSLAIAAILAAAGSASAEGLHWKGSVPAARTPVQTLAQHVSPELQLRQISEDRFGDGDRIVHFASAYRGLPVIGGNASLRIDAAGKAREVFGPGAVQWPTSLTPALAKADAIRAAAPRTRFPVQDAHVHLGLYLRFGEARLAWFAFPTIPAAFPSRVRLTIDAATGELLEAVDLVQHVTAQMYETNPTKSPALTPRNLPLAETTAGTLTNTFLTAVNCVDKKTVKSLFGGQLVVHVCDLENSATLDATSNYSLVPDDQTAAKAEDPFSQLSMYYHATRAYEFFQKLQGDLTAKVVQADVLTAVANLRLPQGSGFGTDGEFDATSAADPDLPLVGYDNAFFSPAAPEGSFDPYGEILGVTTGGMFFGQGSDLYGGRDFAYDGDVVYHEFTHAVVDKTLQLGGFTLDEWGVSAAPSAMNEGLADYFSSAISGEPNLGEYAGAGVQQGGSSIRNLVNTDTCSNSIVGESHADSTLFSGALWTARAQLAPADQTAFDTSIYKTMRANVMQTPTYEEVGDVFLAGLQTDLPAAVPLLTAAFTEKGVLPKCTRLLEQANFDTPIAAPRQSRFFMAPGGPSIGIRRAPGVVQGHSVIPAGATKLTFEVLQLFTYSQGFGRNSKFEPKLAVRFGAEPIKWTVATTPKAPADVIEVELTPDEGDAPVEVLVPEGATEVYFQIVNDGEADGVYRSFGVLDSDAPKPGSSSGRPDGGTSGVVGDGGTDVAATNDGNGDGCGCHGAPARDVGGHLALLSVVAGLFAARRRRAGK